MKGDSLLSKSTVRIFLKRCGMRVATEAFQELEIRAAELLERAVSRAKKNGRRTIMPQDL